MTWRRHPRDAARTAPDAARVTPLWADIGGQDKKGVALEEAEQHEATAQAYQQVYEMMRESLGAGHPDLAMPLNNLAVVRQKQGQYDTAKELFRQAIGLLGRSVREARFGDTLLANIANLFTEICDRHAPWPGDDFDGSLTGLTDKPEGYTMAPECVSLSPSRAKMQWRTPGGGWMPERSSTSRSAIRLVKPPGTATRTDLGGEPILD